MTLTRMFGLMVGFVGARLVGAALGLLCQLVLARLLPQSDVGVVLMAMSAAAFISLFAIGGHAMLASTELPKILERGSRQRLQAFMATTLRNATFGIVLLAVIVSLLVWFTPLADGTKLALVFGLAAAPAAGLSRFNAMVANSHRRFHLSYAPDFLLRPGLFLVVLLALAIWAHENFMLEVLIAYVLLSYAVSFWVALRLGRDGLLPRYWNHVVLRYASAIRGRTLALTLTSAVLLATADIVTMIAGLLLPPHDLAVVGITVRLAAIAGFALQAAQLFVLPDFTAASTRRDDAAVDALLWKMNGMVLAVVAAGIAGIYLLGAFVLGFFGNDYRDGLFLLFLFMVSQSVRALGGMNQSLLSFHGHQTRSAFACLLALVVLVTLSILCVKAFGAVGMGYAVIGAECVWLVALASQAATLTGRRGDVAWLLIQRWGNRGGHSG